jgi:hypothetical protein
MGDDDDWLGGIHRICLKGLNQRLSDKTHAPRALAGVRSR